MTRRIAGLLVLVSVLLAVEAKGFAQEREVTIAAVGDILFGRYSEQKKYMPVVPEGVDPFGEVAPILRQADLAFCNIESPIVEEPKSFGVYKRMTFRASPERLKAIVEAGFDVVSLANNHMFNMKAAAVPPTVLNVANAGLRAGGAGATPADAVRPVLVEVAGKRIAFLFYTVWHNTGKSGFTREASVNFWAHEGPLEKVAVPAVRAARRYLRADYVIVSVHWGIEYEPHPHRGQEKLAKALYDNGVDLILGHHPHVVQDVRLKRGVGMVFSMGNFVFDNPTLDRRESLIFHTALKGVGPLRHVTRVELDPIMIDRKTRFPTIARGKDGARWRKRLATLVGPGVVIRPEPPILQASTP